MSEIVIVEVVGRVGQGTIGIFKKVKGLDVSAYQNL